MTSEFGSKKTSTRDEEIIVIYLDVADKKVRALGDPVQVGHPALAVLGGFANELIRSALEECFVRLASVPKRGPTLNQWLEQVLAREDSRISGVNLDLSDEARFRPWQLVYARSEAARLKPGDFNFPSSVLIEACSRLRSRVGAAAVADTVLKQRRPLWRTPPSGSFAGAPIIDCDDVEIAVVAVLASTTPKWQFSSQPDGQIFRGFKSGFHSAEERTFVSGLSDIIDTVSDVVSSHRNGAGGRVFISKQDVECAECRMVVAWIQNIGGRPTALIKCSKGGRS